MKTNTYKAKNNTDVVLDVANDQKNDRPSKYILIDADFLSDVAVALGKTEGKAVELLRAALKTGLDNLKIDNQALKVDDYNFSTSHMTPNIRNIGTHEQQQALYRAMIEEQNKPKTATADVLVPVAQLDKNLLDFVRASYKQLGKWQPIADAIANANPQMSVNVRNSYIAAVQNEQKPQAPKVPNVPTTPTIPNVITEKIN